MTLPSASSGDGASIDDILDANAQGLLYFERFLPLASRVPGVDIPRYQDVCARYDEQRGLNLGALGADADAVGTVSAVLTDQLEEQVQLRRVLQLRWHGDAGEAVRTYLSAEQEKASQFLASIEDSHQTMCAAVDVLRDAVTDKAELVGGIDIELVDGKDVDQIDAIVVASGIECLPVDREAVFPRLASAFEDLKDRALGGDVSDEFAAEVTERCRRWIDTEFVPRVQGTCEAVLAACTATDIAVERCLALVVDVLGSVHEPSFGELDESSWAMEPGTSALWPGPDGSSADPGPAEIGSAPAVSGAEPAAVGSAAVGPAAVGPAAVGPAASLPGGHGPAGADTVLSAGYPTADNPAGDEVGDSLDGLVDRVVAGIVDRIDDALTETIDGRDLDGSGDTAVESRAGENDTKDAAPDGDRRPEPAPLPPPGQASPTPGDERGHLEAELDGHRARIALEHDGVVSLELETPGLGTRSFEMRIGPFGLPEIVEIPGVADAVDVPAPASALPSEPVLSSEPVLPSEPVPATEPVPAAESVLPSEPVPATEPVPNPEPVPATEPVLPSEADSDVQAQCSPESPDLEQPAEQHPVAADRSVADAQPAAPSTGAGLSEAGAL
ncbi:hypothetical protein CH306_00730 [Rhodococcus sp. 15-725-2-2b]|uniref:hypothetical protein n=1 Tax=unclassified Rhodococcus (in: high G+C Gram-positive bacteria) TaxID=192944 RepID=UPI000B9C54AA|nr:MULTISPECIES: hypothetical protein [unclassified Rhodococcus (in: high G+C Gram-positive bacteria)]OZC63968.1 hypothetical protein CH277_21195 [Rhodococcus sp. 06-469-3-2]OZD51516.1 hypothetical protein CH264_01180 [Rhodococcus sp. 06-1477-1A]OZE78668.1 hypothetical protein CH306_00730 [Rhodococcus sp. 15-725-2-2b]